MTPHRQPIRFLSFIPRNTTVPSNVVVGAAWMRFIPSFKLSAKSRRYYVYRMKARNPNVA